MVHQKALYLIPGTANFASIKRTMKGGGGEGGDSTLYFVQTWQLYSTQNRLKFPIAVIVSIYAALNAFISVSYKSSYLVKENHAGPFLELHQRYYLEYRGV